MSDEEEFVTARALRARGEFVPSDIPDDAEVRVSKAIRGDELVLEYQVRPMGQVTHVTCSVNVDDVARAFSAAAEIVGSDGGRKRS